MAELDSAVKALNLGISCWVTFAAWSGMGPTGQRSGEYQLGYAKIGGKWGIGVRSISSTYSRPDDQDVTGPWLFNEAPRNLRADAVEHLPKLLNALATEAVATAKKLADKLDQARQLASAVKNTAEQPRS